MSDVLLIDWVNLSFVSIFVVILLLVSLVDKLKLEKTILIATLRSVTQLILIGYLILFIFDFDNAFVVFAVFALMCLIGANTLVRRLNIKDNYYTALISIALSSMFSIVWISQIVVEVSPWYSARYIIPLSGIIIANCINGATLAGERYKSEISLRIEEIEMLLSLGFAYREASRNIRRASMNTALTPPLNNMMLMGIVHLPGIMTGQIMAGVNPLIAIKYQIAIVFCIAGSTAIASYTFLSFLDRYFFTPHHQIRYSRLSPTK